MHAGASAATTASAATERGMGPRLAPWPGVDATAPHSLRRSWRLPANGLAALAPMAGPRGATVDHDDDGDARERALRAARGSGDRHRSIAPRGHVIGFGPARASHACGRAP